MLITIWLIGFVFAVAAPLILIWAIHTAIEDETQVMRDNREFDQ